MPTMSAPAALRGVLRSCRLANTATRTVLPVPAGSTVEPRTGWSDFFASMPRLTATSTDSSNFALANSLTSFSASSIGYCLPGCDLAGSRPSDAWLRSAMSEPSTSMPMLRALPAIVRTAASRSAAVRSGSLAFAISSTCLRVTLADLVGVRLAAALLDPTAFLISTDGRRRLHDEREAAVAYTVMTTGIGRPGSMPLRLRVERLAELHDVQAALTERGADRRARDSPCLPAPAA